MNKVRPFLKWAGSKYNCLEHVIPSLPRGKRLIEPFAGSGVIFMNGDYPAYLLAEANPDLINLFKKLQHDGESFIEYCQAYFKPEFNCATAYYELRSEFNLLPMGKKRAAVFLYLNRHGYNGLCRYNSLGIYNVPFGLYDKPYFPREEMMLFHQKSEYATFTHNDFRKTFALAEPGDVIYCDPPYVLLTEKSKPVPYTKKQFTEEDQISLSRLAEETAARGIAVIISNHDTPFTRTHYRNAEIKSFGVSRLINCNGDGRQPVRELIAVFGN